MSKYNTVLSTMLSRLESEHEGDVAMFTDLSALLLSGVSVVFGFSSLDASVGIHAAISPCFDFFFCFLVCSSAGSMLTVLSWWLMD